MRSERQWLTAVAAAAALAGCSGDEGGALQTDAAAPASLPANECLVGQTDEERIDYARQFREEFGLRADEAWIREVESDPEARRQACEWGQSLTADEVASVIEYSRLLGEFDTIVERYLVRRPAARATYAGRFGEGGDFHVGFTRNASAHGARIARRFSRPDRIRPYRARWTEAELERLVSRIGRDTADLRAAGVDLACARVDIEGNGVVVGLENPTDSEGAELRRRYGPAVSLGLCDVDT